MGYFSSTDLVTCEVIGVFCCCFVLFFVFSSAVNNPSTELVLLPAGRPFRGL